MHLSVYLVIMVVVLATSYYLAVKSKDSTLFDKKEFAREVLIILMAVSGIYWTISLLLFLANILIGAWS